MNKNKGVIRFNNYKVINVEFKLNTEFSWGEKEVDLDIQADSDICLSENKKEMLIGLEILIFEHNEDKKYPFTMKVRLEGYFTMEDEGNDIGEYYANALAILFPYARAIISNITANANIEPLILPTVNINSLIKHQKEKNNGISKK